MFSRLFRQRRRMVVLVLGAMLAGALGQGIGPFVLWFGVAGLALAGSIILIAPHRRAWIEALGIGLVLATLPGLDAGVLPLAVIASAALTHLAVHGRWSDATPLRLGLVSHRISRVRATPAQVWAALIPGESHPDDHWTGTLVDYDHDPDDPYTTYLRYRTPDGLHEGVTITFLDHVPLQTCRYVIERFDEGFAQAGDLTLRLGQPDPDHCDIDSTLLFASLMPRVALGRWLDDTFGDEWDSFAAKVSARRDWSIHGLPSRQKIWSPLP